MLLADVALCSLPGLHPFLAHRNLFLCKLKYIQKINTTLLRVCMGIRFTVGLNDLAGIFQPRLFYYTPVRKWQ